MKKAPLRTLLSTAHTQSPGVLGVEKPPTVISRWLIICQECSAHRELDLQDIFHRAIPRIHHTVRAQMDYLARQGSCRCGTTGHRSAPLAVYPDCCGSLQIIPLSRFPFGTHLTTTIVLSSNFCASIISNLDPFCNRTSYSLCNIHSSFSPMCAAL